MRRLFVLALMLVAVAPACADDLPPHKPGLWEMSTSFERGGVGPGQHWQYCVDAATDRLMNDPTNSQNSCTPPKISNAGGTVVVDTVCKYPTMTMSSHSEITGNYDSGYTMKVTTRQDGGPPGTGNTAMTLEAKWLGPCKADQRPGDMMMSNGLKMNAVDMLNSRSSRGGAGSGRGANPK